MLTSEEQNSEGFIRFGASSRNSDSCAFIFGKRLRNGKKGVMKMRSSKKGGRKAGAAKGQIKGKIVKITRVNPGNVRPSFVNDLIISHSENEFVLTFGVMEPPAIIDEKELEAFQQVEAIAVAKLVVTPNFAEKVLNALSKNIDNYKQVFKKNDK
jgi:hypothetical protein